MNFEFPTNTEFALEIFNGSPNKLLATPPTSFNTIRPPAKSQGCNLGVI